MNFIAKNMLAIVLFFSGTAIFAATPEQIAAEQAKTAAALSHLFPGFHNKTKGFILSGVELGRTFVEGVWKIVQPELHKFGTYIKGNFVKDLANIHMGENACNTNLDIAKSIGAKALAVFALYEIGYWAQKAREKKYGLCYTRGIIAWAFSDYNNEQSPKKREAWLMAPTAKWAARGAVVASLIV
ncbi:hypothetical protein JST99_02870 [Candidatus Dependentiae bacterium]|nr:hypothetical protein [Candidatus Dependentiae bacterium]MCC7414898.1 hypothetical protein [Campylobacterota bacterium]